VAAADAVRLEHELHRVVELHAVERDRTALLVDAP
jgi:hypothetical protein